MTFNFDESFKKQLKIELDTLISCISPYIVKCYNVFLAVIYLLIQIKFNS